MLLLVWLSSEREEKVEGTWSNSRQSQLVLSPLSHNLEGSDLFTSSFRNGQKGTSSLPSFPHGVAS